MSVPEAWPEYRKPASASCSGSTKFSSKLHYTVMALEGQSLISIFRPKVTLTCFVWMTLNFWDAHITFFLDNSLIDSSWSKKTRKNSEISLQNFSGEKREFLFFHFLEHKQNCILNCKFKNKLLQREVVFWWFLRSFFPHTRLEKKPEMSRQNRKWVIKPEIPYFSGTI